MHVTARQLKLKWFKTKDPKVIPSSLINTPTDKFQKGINFWGAVSSRELIPFGGNLYAKFLKEEVKSAIKLAFKNTALIPIFQDDQDNKHRTKVVMNTIESLFDECIDPEIVDAKFTDIWTIETVWGAIKEKLRGERTENE
ncbi:unnamed protein product [Rotaria sp. Silwood1]|nr:unnamed protein product [Rotaria sp. Silwood1]